MDTVYAVVVTFQPDLDDLHENMLLLSAMVDKVIICNNSDFDIDLPIERVEVINLKGNFGIAYAQSVGMKASFENGADFVFKMDQDSLVPKNIVPDLLNSYYELEGLGYNVGLIGPLDYDKITGEVNRARVNKGVSIFSGKYSLVDSTLSSGSLIPKKSYNKVGGMFDQLFIDVVDHEYCWRLRAADFDVIRANYVRLPHRLGDGRRKLLGLVSVGIPAPFRHYYSVRNTIYLVRKPYIPIKWKVLSMPKIFLKLVFYPFLLDNGYLRFRYILKGIYHGFIGQLGKLKE